MESQSLQLTTSQMPINVVVDMRRRPGMNPQRSAGRGATLMPEFKGRDSRGDTKIYRFKDIGGTTFSPTLPLPIDISTPHGQKLLNTFKAYKLFIDDNLLIHDPIQKARKEISDDDLMLEAMSRLKELRLDKDTETLNNLLRRLEGPIGAKTQEVVVSTLLRIAKTNPASILELDKDPRFQQKVLVDKAIEAKKLVQRDRYYYYPDGVNDSRLIAEGIDKLLHEMRENDDLAIYIKQAAHSLTEQPIEAAPGLAATMLTAEQLQQLRELDGLGDDPDEVDEGDGEFIDPESLTEDQIRQTVKKAIETKYLESDGGGKVKCPDEKFRVAADAEVFFVANPRAAKALMEEMEQMGM